MQFNDTIAAIATAPGVAGIAIVRISGPDALPIADRIFRASGPKPSERAAGTFTVGRILAADTVIDQALLLVMRAPHSYTGEDVVELQGHGGDQNAKRVLRAVLDAGARPAGPGEFTQRAFLNGRMDLAQAEAVLDLIHARSERAATAALDQLQGGLSRDINGLYDDLIQIAADVEATLDFPEDELPETVMPDLVKRTTAALDHINRLIQTWDEGHLLRDGALIVISGKPNVGKSTLLNALLGRDRAIVSPIPGTTRDTIEEDVSIKGIPVRLIDTAGLREAEDEIEQIGIQRTRDQMGRADLHIHMLDATQPVDQQDMNTMNSLPEKRRLILMNKNDLTNNVLSIQADFHYTKISATQLYDTERVKESIFDKLTEGLELQARPQATVSERHRRLLCEARDELSTALDMLSTAEEELVALTSYRLRAALESIGLVTGRTYHDELLTQIFSRFCIGK